MSMRKLLRSISPFSKRNVAVEDPNIPVGQSTTKPTWSLQGTDLQKVLTVFYTQHNPDKISAIGEILEQYRGEEMVLLYELAEVYNLSQADMQKMIDDSKTGDIDTSSTTSGSMRKSRSRSPAPSSRPGEYKSVVTPQWENRKASPDRASARSTQSSSSRKHKRSGELNPYRPKSDVAEVPKRVAPAVTRVPAAADQSQPKGDSVEVTPKVTPMSLQDIINTSRKNDSLMKKSVRFSPNLELSSEAPSSYHSLEKQKAAAVTSSSSSQAVGKMNQTPHQPSMPILPDTRNTTGGDDMTSADNNDAHFTSHTATATVHDYPAKEEASVRRPVVTVTSRSADLSDPPPAPRIDSSRSVPHVQQGEPNHYYSDHHSNQHQQQQSVSSAHVQRPSSAPVSVSLDAHPTNQHHYNHHHGVEEEGPRDVRDSSWVDARGQFSELRASAPELGTHKQSSSDYDEPLSNSSSQVSRTVSVGLEEMRAELERTRMALTAAEDERFEVLNLLQEVAAAPNEMQGVVESYLDKYGMLIYTLFFFSVLPITCTMVLTN